MWSQHGLDTVYQQDIDTALTSMEVYLIETITENELKRLVSRLGFRKTDRCWILREEYTLAYAYPENDSWREYSVTASGMYGKWMDTRDITPSLLHTDILEILEKNGTMAIAVGPQPHSPIDVDGYTEILLGALIPTTRDNTPGMFHPVASYDAYKLEKTRNKDKTARIVDVLFRESHRDTLLRNAKKLVRAGTTRYIARGHEMDARIKTPAIESVPRGEVTRDLIIGLAPYIENGEIYHKKYWLTREALIQILASYCFSCS